MKIDNFTRHLRNSRGFGLIPLLLVVMGVGIAVAAMYSSVLNVMRSQVSVSVSQDADLIVEQINQVLSKDAVCTAALQGNVLDATPREISAALRLSDNDVIVAQDRKISPGLRVEHFTLEWKLLPDGITPVVQDATIVTNPTAVPPTTVKRRVGKVKIQLRKNEGTFAPLSRPHEMTIHAIVDATNVVSGCTAESSEVISCTASGGVWNALADSTANPPQRKCEPYLQCEYAGAYSPLNGIGFRSSNPAPFPNQSFNNQYGCPAGFTSMQTGTVTKVKSCGKSKPCNDFFPVYSCVRCGQGLSAFAASTSSDLDFDAEGALADGAYGGIMGRIAWILQQRYLMWCQATGSC